MTGGGDVDVEADFRDFVASRQRHLLRTAWLLCGDWQRAEDLVQVALLRAWPHWRRVAGDGSTGAYVQRVMVNAWLSESRRKWRGERPSPQLPEPPVADAPDLDLHICLVAALRGLPPRQRAVLVLRYFADESVEATAAALRCSPGTVKSQGSKALAHLRASPALADLFEDQVMP